MNWKQQEIIIERYHFQLFQNAATYSKNTNAGFENGIIESIEHIVHVSTQTCLG